MPDAIDSNAGRVPGKNRRIRVFISSTFRDMMEERDVLMSHAWPTLRCFCLERHVELVEVDMRWGITEEQSTRKETLKLCLDEIRSCRPYFIGLIGERYGWIPGDEAFTADLKEEQSWIAELHGKSVTELEILHGVLNNPEMADRSFFYFRDPVYSKNRGVDFQAEESVAAGKLADLKRRIRNSNKAGQIQLHEDYPDPATLSKLVLEHLKSAIDKQFPKEDIPDSLTREANSHESFAEIRRRTYIGRDDYFKTLDRHADSNAGPLVLLGDSGSGKTALLANWIAHWKKEHTGDFIFQHYIGGTPDSTDHWKMIKRLMTEIKKWADDPDKLPTSHDDIVRDFPLWLSKVRLKAERDSVQCILVLDALNQLDGQDNSRFLGWLPPEAFTGPLHLVVSTLPGDTMDAVKKFGWETLHIEKLTKDERRRMIVDYLNRFGKKLDLTRIDQIIATSAAANPLYLKILLDELRITGTHDKLDERLNIYLAEPDVPALLKNVLIRYQCHYERDREGLVKEALGLIFSARRGLSETELLQLLRPADLEQLPQAVWTPLRAAMEELLIDRGGILNFAHEFLRTAVKETFVPGRENQDDLRLWLAGYFEAQTASSRSCDELPWLLQQTKSMDRLRTCLLNVDCFLEILKRDINELRSYWIGLNEQMVMGKAYLKSFEKWVNKRDLMSDFIGYVAYKIAYFLHDAALYKDAEPLYRRGLSIYEKNFGKDHPNVATGLCSLAGLLRLNDRMDEAEPLMRRALAIDEKRLGNDHPNVAMGLSSLARLLKYVNRLVESEPLMRRALSINEKNFGKEHPKTASDLSNLAGLFSSTNRLAEAEQLMRKALSINEKSLGKDHPNVALNLNNIAILLKDTNRIDEAESLYRRTLGIYEKNFGKDHPSVAISLTNFANLLKDTNRIDEAESLYRRALGIYEKSFGNDHTYVATCLGVFAQLLKSTNRMDEAELLMRRALGIYEKSLDENHPYIATALNILSALLKTTNRVDEAEPLIRRALSIYEKSLGKDHPHVAEGLNILAGLLEDTNRMDEAEALYRRMLSIREKNNGPDSWQFASALNNLSVLYRKMGRFAAAEPLSERSVTTYEKSLGHGHPNTPNAGTNLAYLKFLMNKSDEAAALCFKYLDAHRENQEKTGSIPTTQLKKLADCYHALAIYSNVPAEKWKEAEDHCRLSLEYFKRLEDSGGFAKAEQLLNQVLKKKQSSN